MSDEIVFNALEDRLADQPTATRRQALTATAGMLAGMGLLGVPALASAGGSAKGFTRNDPTTILAVAATAEVLATIVNTVGWEKGLGGDDVTQRNIRAAAREELIHYNTLVSKAIGATPLTKRIWVPDAVFANRTNFLSTLEVGDQIFVNAYLIGIKEFGFRGRGDLAGIAAEFMGVEAVHRALARQSLGKLGNDRAYMRFDQREMAKDAPNFGEKGTSSIARIPRFLTDAGFGFGTQGATPGRFYDFDEVRKRTPDDPGVNTRTPDIE